MPILFVLIHINGFLGFVGFDKLLLCLFESVFILKMEGELQMDFWKLVLGVGVGQSESLFEFLLVGLEVNCCLN
jgi:hypothetical protein